MMIRMRKYFFIAVVGSALLSAASDPLLLKQYAGSWKVTRKSTNGQAEDLKIICAQVGKSYACEQAVAGSVRGLLVFIPGGTPAHFTTQNIQPDGRATGKGELAIEGNRWIFTNTWYGGAVATHYRTTNVFTTPNQIHFEQEESTDGTHWQTKDSGEEMRTSK